MSLIERPHHNILYAVGKSKLANVVLIPCKLLGDQVRFARDRRSIGRQGRCLDRSRSRRERTDEWQSIQQWTLWPEQELYEQIRPILLFGETAGERAKEIDAAQRTLSRKADEFERDGMMSLFSS